ncbi:MAG TPA: D-glycero-beta-D-manno-heptose 1-phosphate adenylyltransferase [Patescibacteria group bacterium]|nr:D-glycero-beta-D-manno-heptose 1-phosphate adenylyltransferase [Patescibacteria group bacterium]
MESRILAPPKLESFRRTHRNKRIVFTNGCFDILHRGHVALLLEAKRLGDVLVVGINSDQSMHRLKGPSRPLVNEDDRAFLLLQLRPVDYVTVFGEDTPLETIRALEPDVLVKGGEYEREGIVGADFVEERGGTVVRVAMVGGYSTRGFIEKIRG